MEAVEAVAIAIAGHLGLDLAFGKHGLGLSTLTPILSPRMIAIHSFSVAKNRTRDYFGGEGAPLAYRAVILVAARLFISACRR